MRARAFAAILSLLAATGWATPSKLILTDCTTSEYKPGQVWSYHTRPQEAGSTFTVVKVERSEATGVIVHISVKGLKSRISGRLRISGALQPPAIQRGGDPQERRQAAQEKRPLPDFKSGYLEWREAFEHNKGGIWTSSIAQAIAVMDGAMSH